MPRVTDDHLAARRRQILDGARRCFAEYGYDKATVRRLEQTIGLSRGAIFHHFRDKDTLFFELAREDADTWDVVGKFGDGKKTSPAPGRPDRDLGSLPTSELAALVHELSDQMHAAAKDLQFETAARLRDEIADLKKTIRQITEATK